MTRPSPISARRTGLRSARFAPGSLCCAARWVCSPRRASPLTGASSKPSTIAIATSRAKVERRRAQLEESVARYLSQLDTADLQQPSEALAAKTAHLKEKLARLDSEMQRLALMEKQMLASPDQQISLTDPDSRSMATSGRGSGVVGYNVQVAVDTESHLIITHEVTNVGSDRAQLARMAKATKATLERTNLDVIADRGYFSSEEILECDKAGITVTLPKPMTSNPKRFGKQDFRYMAEEDVYICPAGERLTHSFTTQEHGLVLRR